MMHVRSPRTVLAISAVVALTAAALAPVSALAKGPGAGGGWGAADRQAACDEDRQNDQAQLQARARDGSGDQAQTRGRQGWSDDADTQAPAGGGRGWGQSDEIGQRGARLGLNDPDRGPGSCEECADIEPGTLTEEQQATLVYMADEEKLAYDLYVALGTMYEDALVFDRIAQSEARHQEAVRTVMARYEIADPTADLGPGEFYHADVKLLYDTLIAQGQESLEQAIAVGLAVETDDLEELEAALAALDHEAAPDVYQMYEHLMAATERHFGAFSTNA